MKTLTLFILTLSGMWGMALWAKDAPVSLAEKISTLESEQKGVSISGELNSEYMSAGLEGKSANPEDPSRENLAFARGDILLSARPGKELRGRALFRIHQDFQNYYDEGPNPFSTRWFSVDGHLGGKLEFNIGDYHIRYTPLTLYNPDTDLMMEPLVFSERRKRAMGEFFLEDNQRPLQGLRADYTLGWGSSHYLKLGTSGARLRSTNPTAATTWLFNTDDSEKFYLGGYAGLHMFKGVELGLTDVLVLDRVNSTRAQNNAYVLGPRGNLYENSNVVSGTFSLDAEALFGLPLPLKLSSELAVSSYRQREDYRIRDTLGTQEVSRQVVDPVGTVITILDTVLVIDSLDLGLREITRLDGRAVRIALNTGLPVSSAFNLNVELGYTGNEKEFISDLAQSTPFNRARILNSKNNITGWGEGYSTFDALYSYVYRVDPVNDVNSTELYSAPAYNGTNNWYRAAMFKNAYNSTVSTYTERQNQNLDPHLQLIMPAGLATPNRQGMDVNLSGGILDAAVEVLGRLGVYSEVKAPTGAEVFPAAADVSMPVPKADFMGWALGSSFDIRKLTGLGFALDVSGSYSRNLMDRASFTGTVAGAALTVEAFSYTSDMINAGLETGWGRVTLLEGFQRLTSNPVLLDGSEGDLIQNHYSSQVRFKLTQGAYVSGAFTLLDLKETATTTEFSQAIYSLDFRLWF